MNINSQSAWSIKKTCLFGVSLCLFSLWDTPAHAEYTVGTLSTKVEIVSVAPSCNITVPDKVDLGILTMGAKEHAPFNITINCKTKAKTALVAEPVKGEVKTSYNLTMTNGSLLSIMENGNYVPLDGSGSFCAGEASGDRVCKLVPRTAVRQNDSVGAAEAVLKFKITYPV
ncbi:hypothetical protein G3142_005455 [Salmonella enterica subsp. enterica serovar Montevideo]|nr:hypothetical protein [Salmonella enterica subsp. enterica serovar Montevideo]EEK7813091.1 hypothetical protein [Salmonella enterica subsp. enterica serovar Montevideo]